MRTLVADGNFKQDHLAMKRDSEDVALSDGLGFMVARKQFDEYLEEASKQTKVPLVSMTYSLILQVPDVNQVSSCHEHRAVTQQNHAQSHLDVTGIGAIACGRHGCFYPHSIVNFRKGEGLVRNNTSFPSFLTHPPDNGILTLHLFMRSIMYHDP